MANSVFANGREIACKAGVGKTICAFPDVCFTPPENPATPPGVPVPYPNTGMASDTTDGSKKVKISDKEVGLKNKSSFKKSMGDEAGAAAKKGVVTSKNTGKVFFNAWSMDVKIEGQNAVRHLDLTTNNHASMPGDTPPWPYLDSMASDLANDHPCKKDATKEDEACGKLYEKKPDGSLNKAASKRNICDKSNEDAKKCREAQKCRLVPQDTAASENSFGCCSGDEAHHLVEAHGFIESGTRDGYSGSLLPKFSDAGKSYKPGDAPCVCASGKKGGDGEHADMHSVQGALELGAITRNKIFAWNYAEARAAGITAHKAVFVDNDCSEACLQKQLDSYHKEKCEFDDEDLLRTTDPGLRMETHQLGKGFELIHKLATQIKKSGGLVFPS